MPPLFFVSAIDYEAAFLQALFWTVLSESLALWVGLFCMQYGRSLWRRGWTCGGGSAGNGEDGGDCHRAELAGEPENLVEENLFASPWFSPGRIFLGGFFASFATLPYLWFVLPRCLSSYTLYAFGGEAFVILGEALFYTAYFRFSPKTALLLSLACNLASLGVGKLLGLY